VEVFFSLNLPQFSKIVRHFKFLPKPVGLAPAINHAYSYSGSCWCQATDVLVLRGKVCKLGKKHSVHLRRLYPVSAFLYSPGENICGGRIAR